MNDKLLKLQKSLKENRYDQLIISSYYNLLYFGNISIHSGERMLVLLVDKEEKPVLFVNRLFTAVESEDYRTVYYDDTDDCTAVLGKYIRGSKIAVDGNWTADFLLRLMKNSHAVYVQGSHLMASIRAIKDKDEQKKMKKASSDNDEVMKKILPFIKVGMSEMEIYSKLLQLFEETTHEPVSFEPIVAFGRNAADPHHESDGTILKKGEPVLIDMGSHYKNYCSDMTRTFLQKDKKTEEIYDIVLKANLAAEAAVKPGVRFSDIDKAAREVIEKAGYGQYFTHRTGHGIGLEIHEPYDVSSSNHLTVQEGMCFSIEPGIYLPDNTGVRIEDLVIVGKDSAIVLNKFSKEKTYLITEE